MAGPTRTCTCTGTVRDTTAFDTFTSGAFPGASGSRDGDRGTVNIDVPASLPDETASAMATGVAKSGASLTDVTCTPK